MAGLEAKQGDPQGPEMRPFTTVTPEEIQDILGGAIMRDPDSDWAAVDAIGSSFILNSELGGAVGKHSWLELDALYSQEENFLLDDAEGILGPDFVTVVAPLEAGHGRQVVKWATVVSHEGTTLYTRQRNIGHPWPADVTPNILRAAGKATARLQMAGAVQAR